MIPGPTGALLNGDRSDAAALLSNYREDDAGDLQCGIDAAWFVSYLGTKVLSQNPRIVALQKDPEIARQVGKGNYVGLLGNPKILAAVSDPSLEALVKSFELEKALDYALGGDGASPGKAPGGKAD